MNFAEYVKTSCPRNEFLQNADKARKLTQSRLKKRHKKNKEEIKKKGFLPSSRCQTSI
jgi:hypothetical protein